MVTTLLRAALQLMLYQYFKPMRGTKMVEHTNYVALICHCRTWNLFSSRAMLITLGVLLIRVS
jgi:hypothetical protein